MKLFSTRSGEFSNSRSAAVFGLAVAQAVSALVSSFAAPAAFAQAGHGVQGGQSASPPPQAASHAASQAPFVCQAKALVGADAQRRGAMFVPPPAMPPMPSAAPIAPPPPTAPRPAPREPRAREANAVPMPASTPAPAPAAVAAAMPKVAPTQPAAQRMAQLSAPVAAPFAAPSTAQYASFQENPWQRVAQQPVSTFSADVDTGSYANVRRFINSGQLPPKDAVRVEEMVNYFSYRYELPAPDHAHPFAVATQLNASPWHAERQILRIGIQGKDLAKATLPAANLVFLVDVSGSMSPQDRLPLVKSALKLLAQQTRAQDRISIVTYANGTEVVLPATPGNERDCIHLAIDGLHASGGTYGEAGIRTAYAQAKQHWIAGGINRVLLTTDGDLNIGVSNRAELKTLIEQERKSGVGLTTLGVGDSNYNEALMKTLANAGNGSYHYLDSLQEAHKVLVNQFSSTLHTIAHDVKIQIEFNPARVSEYRLLGYELRALRQQDFNNDQVDAGEIGAGHQMTALYEVVPAGAKGAIDPLRYGKPPAAPISANGNANSDELAWVKLRYKKTGDTTPSNASILMQQAVPAQAKAPAPQGEAAFAIAVAGWAQWLRGSTEIGRFTPQDAIALSQTARAQDRYGHRAEFERLAELSAGLRR